jgi:hypothetical protein
MQDDLRDWFLKSRQQYVTSVRTCALVLVALTLIHVGTFSQFLVKDSRLRAAEKSTAALTVAGGALKEAADSLASVESRVNDLASGLGSLEKTLRADFEALDAALKPGGSDLGPDSRSQDLPIDRRPFVVDEALKRRVAETSNIRDRRQILVPFITANIIDPRFEELNRDWKGGQLPTILTAADDATGSLAAAREALAGTEAAELAARLPEVEKAVNSLRVGAEAFTFQPPTDAIWWASEKNQTLEAIGREAADRLAGRAATVSLAGVRKDVSAAAAQADQVLTQATDEIAAIEAGFQKQQEEAARLAKPFAFFTVDLAFFVSCFPLLVGLCVGGAIAWLDYCRLDLVRHYRLIRPQHPELDPWNRVFGVVPPKPGGSMWRPAILGMGWVVVAVAELLFFRHVPWMVGAALLLGGSLPVLLAMRYRAALVGEAFELGKNTSVADNAE